MWMTATPMSAMGHPADLHFLGPCIAAPRRQLGQVCQICQPPPPLPGQRFRPHLHVPNIMKPPMRFHSNSKRAVKALVVISPVAGNHVTVLTGTKADGMQAAKTYMTGTGNRQKLAKGMTEDEYLDGISAAMRYFMEQEGFMQQHGRWALVHDGSRAHPQGPFTVLDVVDPSDILIQVIKQPPRSPDLMPLDYYLFGVVKRQLQKEMPPWTSWHDRAARFVDLLRETPTRQAILSFKARLQKCVDANGGHFE